MKWVLALLLFLSLSQAVALTIELDKPKAPLREKPRPLGPAILDTREAFEYATNHYVESQPIRWEDYSQTEEPFKSLIDPSVSLLARKLRVLGVSPSREVIVLGRGKKGGGEEGRIAWMLSYLGVENVRMQSFDSFSAQRAVGLPSKPQTMPIWIAHPKESLRIRKKELVNLVEKKTAGVQIIDVRSVAEFQGKKTNGEKRPGHIPGAISIPWTDFIDDKNNILEKEKLLEVLKKNKVNIENELIFYCSGGLRSSYVTFGAHKANLRARNFDGSFWEWAADTSLPVN